MLDFLLPVWTPWHYHIASFLFVQHKTATKQPEMTWWNVVVLRISTRTWRSSITICRISSRCRVRTIIGCWMNTEIAMTNCSKPKSQKSPNSKVLVSWVNCGYMLLKALISLCLHLLTCWKPADALCAFLNLQHSSYMVKPICCLTLCKKMWIWFSMLLENVDAHVSNIMRRMWTEMSCGRVDSCFSCMLSVEMLLF